MVTTLTVTDEQIQRLTEISEKLVSTKHEVTSTQYDLILLSLENQVNPDFSLSLIPLVLSFEPAVCLTKAVELNYLTQEQSDAFLEPLIQIQRVARSYQGICEQYDQLQREIIDPVTPTSKEAQVAGIALESALIIA